MKLPLLWIDAFTQKRFHGNPAAVVIADKELDTDLMQSIATENNLAETAFVVPNGERYAIRWFTPTMEVDLCGHATLASAYALHESGYATGDTLAFGSRSGTLTVARQGDRLVLDFPTRPATPDSDFQNHIAKALKVMPTEVHRAREMMAVLQSEEEVRSLRPCLDSVLQLPGYGLVVTAPGQECDFVSRFFAPQVGVPEDPVTGSTHCTLIPYWSRRLGKKHLHARQLSARGGELWCEDRGDRVTIAGHCALYLRGEISV
jgi:PhzF family phenazine biosynthesis protein